MPVRNQRGGNLIDRVRHQTELRALEQARRVPWQRLAAVADEYTEWEVLGLWVRAGAEDLGRGQSWRRPGASRRWSRRRWSQGRLCCLPASVRISTRLCGMAAVRAPGFGRMSACGRR